MKINNISSNLIKPHTPTPPNLKNYKISVIDQHAGPLNFAVILFYESKPENDNHLQESLAKILVEFYPLAGRYMKNDHMVDCSDEGAEFIEAEALDVKLIDLVAKIETDQLNALLPEPYFRIDEAADHPLLSIKATHFPCRGLAVAISVSHRVFDGSSLGTFVAAWSTASKLGNNKNNAVNPSFDIPSLLPYDDRLGHGVGVGQNSTSIHHDVDYEETRTVAKRFLFNKGAITTLKSKIMRRNDDGETTMISRVRVVCAVISKALIGLDGAKHGRCRDFVIIQGVNMRERTILRLPRPKHSCGNLYITSLARGEAEDTGFEALVDLIGDSVRKSIADCAEMLSGRDIVVNNFENFMKGMSNTTQTNVISFTDWSKFGFYEADFGWGKPVWTTIGPIRPPFTSTTVLMSNKEGDGIEAWVHLNEDDMRSFEEDHQIKFFTT